MVKNVPTMIVKVFELNAKNYYRSNTNEINTDLNLDGLIANEEKTYKYEESPLRRVARQFEFPSMNQAGTYIVDFIGSGQSSRALIRKVACDTWFRQVHPGNTSRYSLKTTSLSKMPRC